MSNDEDILNEAKEAFELAVEHEHDNRAEALDDVRFARLAEQWPDNVRRSREKDGRPCLTINRLPTFIRQVVNDARQNASKSQPAKGESFHLGVAGADDHHRSKQRDATIGSTTSKTGVSPTRWPFERSMGRLGASQMTGSAISSSAWTIR